MLLRCGSKMVGSAAAGMAMLAAAGPFLVGVGTGVGVGAALLGGACVARRAIRKRNAWRDADDAPSAGATRAGPEDGEAYPLGAPD